MWIAAVTGLSHNEQGIVSKMASTALIVGNAINLATLIAIASISIVDNGIADDRLTVAAQAYNAFYLAACGVIITLIIALSLSKEKKRHDQADLLISEPYGLN